MARPWRIEFEGALYHVLSRGNEQKNIFWNNEDRVSFLNCLGEMSARFETDIFAYVLMGNHYHILLRTNRANLSKAMQWLGQPIRGDSIIDIFDQPPGKYHSCKNIQGQQISKQFKLLKSQIKM